MILALVEAARSLRSAVGTKGRKDKIRKDSTMKKLSNIQALIDSPNNQGTRRGVK